MGRLVKLVLRKGLELDVYCCTSAYEKIRGLMFKRVLPRNQALLIPSESACIHTFFMRFPIDVFWLDKEFRVVDLERNVRPWRPLVCPRKKAFYILEVSSVYKYKIHLGDRLRLKHTRSTPQRKWMRDKCMATLK